jgi:hypothetical protein
MSLVLDLTSGHLSPQFHLSYDNLFETVSNGRVNPQACVSKWQTLGGFRGKQEKLQQDTGPKVPTDVNMWGLLPQLNPPPTLLETLEILNDPDGNRLIIEDPPNKEQDNMEGKVGPVGNVDPDETGLRLSASLNPNNSY